jgi:protoporphyrinogen oxidase
MNPQGQTDPKRWAVVGGGMVGLTLAHRLASEGHHVTLLERAPTIGGLASAWTVGPVTWDRFYHVILGSDSAWRSVLAELGLDDELVWRPTRTAALADGKLLGVSSPLELLRFTPLTLVQRVRLGVTLLWATRVKDGRALEAVSVEKWLRKLSGNSGFERFWKPLLRAKLGDAWTQASASFIWATAQRLGRARKNGLDAERFGYVPGGYAHITERFTAKLHSEGVAIRTGVGVKEVMSTNRGVVEIGLTDGTVLDVDRVVLTTPASMASSLVPQLSTKEQALLGQIKEQGVVCVSLVLDKPLSDAYLTYLLDDTILTGVVDMSSFVAPEQLGGRGLVYLPRYCAANDPAFSEPDDVVISRFSEALRQVYPEFSRATVIASGVARAKEVFAIPTLGYSDRVLPFTTSVPGVFLVNSSQIVNGTLNVDESVQLANRAFADLVRVPDRGQLAGLAATKVTGAASTLGTDGARKAAL